MKRIGLFALAWIILGGAMIALGQAGTPLPSTVCTSLTQVRSAYTHNPLSNFELAELLNRVAWHNRAGGWGLSGKSGGNRCLRNDGQSIACDILQQGMYIWDVLGSAGDTNGSVVVCGDSMRMTDPSRPLVPPIDPEIGDVVLPPLSDPVLEQLKFLVEAVTTLQIVVEKQSVAIEAFQCPAVVFPDYKGSWNPFWGGRVTVVMKPDERALVR